MAMARTSRVGVEAEASARNEGERAKRVFVCILESSHHHRIIEKVRLF